MSPAVINIVVAIAAFVLLANVRRSKVLDNYMKLRRSMEISVGTCLTAITVFVAVWMFALRDAPMTLADQLVTLAVIIAFGLVAWSNSKTIKRKFVVRPHP